MFSLKKTLRVGKYIASAIIFSIALSGCTLTKKKAAADPNANRILIWGFEEEDVWKPVLRDFQSKNKGYSLVYKKQTFDANYEGRVLNSILSGQGPDIWAMSNDWVYRHKEKLYPMPDSISKTVNMDNQYVPSIKQSVMFNNKIYALSPTSEPLMVYYNPKMFESTLSDLRKQNSGDKEENNRISNLLREVPSTWTDFTEAANLLTKKNGKNIEISGAAAGTGKITYASDIIYLLMMQNETDIITNGYDLATFNLPKDTSTGAKDNPGERALDFFASFADQNSDNYTWNDSLGSDIDAFGSEKAAMVFGYSSLQNYLSQKYPNLRYKKDYVPQVSQDAKQITDFARFTAFGVSRLSKNPVVAWNLVNTLSNTGTNSFSSATKSYTSKKSNSYDTGINKRAAGNPEKNALATANSLVKGRYPVEFDGYIRSAIENVNKGEQDAKSALDLAASKITDMLRNSEW